MAPATTARVHSNAISSEAKLPDIAVDFRDGSSLEAMRVDLYVH